jgi:hypothetical protein
MRRSREGEVNDMTTEEALNQHFVATGIYPAGCRRKDWYAGHWLWLKAGPFAIPFPILRRSGPIVLHDLHHMFAGYAPDWQGEIELAGWELASGGCGWHILYWLDRLTFFATGLLGAPRATCRAFARGRGCRNLYRMDPERVLSMDVDRVRAVVGV